MTLEMSQLEKYPTRKHVIAMTLPFKAEDVYPSFREQLIQKTKKRWAWFSDARKKDNNLGSSLGTLGYLPWEIRQVVFEMVLRGYFEESRERYKHLLDLKRYSYIDEAYFIWAWRSDSGRRPHALGVPDVFELDSYQPNDPDAPTSTMNLRLASLSLKTEFEHYFLHANTFAFQCPRALEQFLGQLACHQKGQLGRFRFEIWKYCGCCTAKKSDDGWKSMASQLPPFIKSLSIEMGGDRLLPRNYGWGMYRGPTELRQFKRAADFFEIMSKMAVRSASRLVISTVKSTSEVMPQEDFEILDTAVSDIERC